MATGNSALQNLEQEVQDLAGVATTVLPGSVPTIGKVTTDVQLGIAALPLAISFFEQIVGGFKALFAHHKALALVATSAAAPPTTPPTP
jgi:hypothetical protein